MSEIKSSESQYKHYLAMCMLGYIQFLRSFEIQIEIKNIKSMYSKKFLPNPLCSKMINTKTKEIIFNSEDLQTKEHLTQHSHQSKRLTTLQKLNNQFEFMTKFVEKEMNWKILRRKIAPQNSLYKDINYPIQIEENDSSLIDFECFLVMFFNEKDILNELHSLSKQNDDYFILEPINYQDINQTPETILFEHFLDDSESNSSSSDDIDKLNN